MGAFTAFRRVQAAQAALELTRGSMGFCEFVRANSKRTRVTDEGPFRSIHHTSRGVPHSPRGVATQKWESRFLVRDSGR